MSRRTVLFLYTELAGYFLAAARRFAELYDVDVHIVRWPVHADAPFRFDGVDWAHLYDRAAFDDEDLLGLANRLDPSFIYVAGWVDSGYCRVARAFRSRGIPVVCGMDTQWRGTLRQRIRLLAGREFIKRCFSHAWVPGDPQIELARRLGFEEQRILQGLYTADVPPFAEVFEETRMEKARSYPRTLLYVGRFVPEKGVDVLYDAYSNLRSSGRARGWSLRLIGAGALAPKLVPGSGITVEPFRATGVPQLAVGAGAFVLPSRVEPWGVVLHEFAATGLPLIASDACGGRTAYVDHGANGYVFRAGDIENLAMTLEALFSQPDDVLLAMGARSHDLALALTPDIWARTASTLLRP